MSEFHVDIALEKAWWFKHACTILLLRRALMVRCRLQSLEKAREYLNKDVEFLFKYALRVRVLP